MREHAWPGNAVPMMLTSGNQVAQVVATTPGATPQGPYHRIAVARRGGGIPLLLAGR